MRRMTVLCLIVQAACCLGRVAAEDVKANPTAQAELRVERVALFKNGLGFFMTAGTLPEDATTIRIGQLPVPAYGTFWVGYSADVQLRRLVTSLEDVVERRPVASMVRLLEANAGARVVLRTGTGDQDVVEGVIRKSAVRAEPPEAPSPYLMDIRRPSGVYGRSGYQPPGGNIVLVETATGLVAVNVGSIVRADFAEDTVVADAATFSLKRPCIRVELAQPSENGRISVSYLARGITWCPSYQLDLSDAEQAAVTARALVVNEVADLEDVDLDLVTGFPHMKFADVLSPMAMSQSLADFLKSLASGRTEGRRDSHLMAQQAMLSNVAGFDDFEGVPLPEYPTAPEGMVSEDLFLYPVGKFSLRRGETAYVPLFTAKMPYRHIYTWKIEDSLDTEGRYRRERPQPGDGPVAEEVWHCCRLRNTLEMPLTTAAAEFVSVGQFVGQDVCYYTAPGAETTIRINRAMNILAEEAEYEVERKRNAADFYGYRYDLVKVRGELRLRSRLDKAVAVEITKELSGEVLENPSKAKDVTTAKGLKKVNPKHVLTWEIDLGPGDEQTLSYVHQLYVRS